MAEPWSEIGPKSLEDHPEVLSATEACALSEALAVFRRAWVAFCN